MLSTELYDIQTEQDVKLLVDDFYNKIQVDPLLGPVFNDIAEVNWDKHLPVMYSFWGSMLLKKRNYHGQPWPAHAALRAHITPAHFTRWIELFHETIDSHFQGPTADLAKQHALNISTIFQGKLAMMPPIPD